MQNYKTEGVERQTLPPSLFNSGPVLKCIIYQKCDIMPSCDNNLFLTIAILPFPTTGNDSCIQNALAYKQQ